MARKTRDTLKEYFKSGKIPTEGNFSDIMDSSLNIVDDQIYIKTVEEESKEEKYVGIGVPTPGERLEVAGNVKAEEFKGKVNWNNITEMPDELMPQGVIVMWNGDLKLFDKTGKGNPEGPMKAWALCNGKNNTPNLEGRFIVGVGKSSNKTTTYNLNETGGEETHKLVKAEIPKHHHSARNTNADPKNPNNNSTIYVTKSGSHNHNYPRHRIETRATARIPHKKTADDNTYANGTSYSTHSHENGTFRGRVGNGAVDGLGDQPHENRPPYYVLAYIMKLPNIG